MKPHVQDIILATRSAALRLAAVLGAVVLVAASGSVYATSTYGTRLNNWCAKQPVRTSAPQQSQPYKASGNSCALCHPNGNTGNLNALGTASRSCSGSGTSTTCGSGVNPYCINTAPTNPTITAPATGTTVNVGQAVTFSGSGTDPDGFALSYTWRFNNGLPNATGQSVSVTPTTAGTLTATLEVRDPNSALAATTPTRSVTVTAPVNQVSNGTIVPPATIVQGQAVTFQGSGTDPDGKGLSRNK